MGLVNEVRALVDLPSRLWGFEAIGSRTDAFVAAKALNVGTAVDDDRDRARRRAIAESLERYCAAIPRHDLVVARMRDFEPGSYLDPRSYPAAGSFDPTALVHWTKVHAVDSGAELWAPTSLVYVPFECAEGPIDSLQSSVGLAAGATLQGAFERAVAEVVERDACLKVWRHRTGLAAVRSDTLGVSGVTLREVPTDTDFTVVAALIERDGYPLTSSGLAARPTLAEAAQHATLEAVQSYVWLRDREGLPYSSPPRTMVDNAMAHATCAALSRERRAWLRPSRQAASKRPTAWADIVRRIPGVHYADLSSPDVESAGLKVVRVLIPGRVIADDDFFFPRLHGNCLPHPFG